MSEVPSQSPSTISRRTPTNEEVIDVIQDIQEDVLIETLATEHGFLSDALIQEELDKLTKADEWSWEIYQRRYFKTDKWYICNKCRQSGGSAALSAKKFAAAAISEQSYTCIMTSYKKEEAVGKIDYVRQYLKALPPEFQKEIVRDPRQLIEWKNSNGTRSKIMSHAQKPIRGASGEVALDELAFYQHADEIYESATPVVSQSGGTIDIVSTPFGKGGRYYDIFMSDEEDDYKRERIYWWHCMRYLKDPSFEFMAQASLLASTDAFDTHRRVEIFGSDSIKSQLVNSKLLESFQQEFECYFIDSSISFFHKDLIVNVMFNNRTDVNDYQALESDFEDMSVNEALKDFSRDEIKKGDPVRSIELLRNGRTDIHGNTIELKKYFCESQFKSESFGSFWDLMRAIDSGEITDNIIIGLDVGLSTNSTDLRILEEVYPAEGGVLQIERGSIEIVKTPLHEQQKYLEQYLDVLPFVSGYGDEGGLGKQMCQYFRSRYSGRFKTIDFATGGPSKVEPFMVNLRSRMANWSIGMSYSRRLIEDLHSIQRVITETKKISYKAPEMRGNHADSAYAMALASYAGTLYSEIEMEIDISRISIPKEDGSESENRKAYHDFSVGDQKVSGYDSHFDAGTEFGLSETYKYNSEWDY